MHRHANTRNQDPTGENPTEPSRNPKSNKKGRRFKKPPDPPSADNSTVNLSTKTLTVDHLSLLDKGLTYCPTPLPNHPCHSLQDTLLFNRRLRLTHHFLPTDQRPSPVNPTTQDPYQLSKPSSGWTPPPGKNLYIDSFIGNFTNHVLHLDHSDQPISNLTQGELLALKDLSQDTSIIIKPADKGGAIVIQSTTDYIKEAMRQLGNRQHYERSLVKLFDQSNKKIKTYLSNCVNSGLIPPATHLLLTTKSPRLPCMYLLPKIHKANNPGRPIISACGGPTEKISAFVDHTLKPLVLNLPSHVKDTAHFINLLSSLDIPDNHIMMTIDVSSLYTNIPHNEGIDACKVYLQQRTVEEPPTWLITTLLRFILTLNYFEFNGKIYHQTSGTAMGTKMAPNYANLFMGQLEFKLVNLHPVKPLLWLRYIDDIFCILPGDIRDGENFLHFLNSQHDTIKFTADISTTQVHFLDVTVSRMPTGQIATSLYRKPTDTYRYLHYKSFHPKHQKKSIPYSQFVRVRRICSNKKDFYHFTNIMIAHLATRKYPMKLLMEAQDRASGLDRDTLLNPPPKPATAKNIPLIITFDPTHGQISTGIRQSLFLLDNVRPPLTNHKVMVTFRRNRNLKDFLVKSTLTSQKKTASFCTPCRKPRCTTCPHIFTTKTVVNRSTQRSYRVATSSDCQTHDVVYLIQCCQCNIQYVGQTSNSLHVRFQQHLRDVKQNNQFKAVSQHYTSPGHSPTDARLTVVDRATALNTRLRLEEAWVTVLSTHQPQGLNQRLG